MIQEAIAAILAVKNTPGAKEKRSILYAYKGDPDFRRLLYYALNPMYVYKASEISLQTPVSVSPSKEFENIYQVCEELNAASGVDKHMLASVQQFLHSREPEESKFYLKLLAKTLRLGVTGKTVNQEIPGLIPEWEVQQAYSYEDHPLREGELFTLTEKLNGVRATYYSGKLIARSGRPYQGLDHITEALKGFRGVVFDGELTLRDKGALTDNEAFRIATGIVNSDDGDKSGICFTIFDALPKDEFDTGKTLLRYSNRRKYLQDVEACLQLIGSADCPVRVLPVLYQGTDQRQIDLLLDEMVRQDKEGLMINREVPYQCRRHNGILKVKRFYTMDLPIIRTEEGSGRLAGTLGALVVDFQGNEVSVGSGFTDQQRHELWEKRNELPGILCEVKYKEISSDKKTGQRSLQFPVFVTLRTDKTEVSYA